MERDLEPGVEKLDPVGAHGTRLLTGSAPIALS